jgi:hsp70-interacting protein
MDYIKEQPTETDVIKAALETLTKGEASPDDWLGALNMLQPLLEPIDNANGVPCLIPKSSEQGWTMGPI